MKEKAYNFMIEKIQSGFVLRVATFGRSMFCEKKHLPLFKNDKGQDFYVGRNCICPAGAGIAIADDKNLFCFNALKNEWVKI